MWLWLGLLLLPFGEPSARAEPLFAERACDLPDVPAAVLPRLQCGTVAVPRDYVHPEIGTFALAVVVVAPGQPPATPDPVVYVSGGPGSPLTIYAGAQAIAPYAPHRALILVDQRGTGRSEPRICPDTAPALLDAAAAVATDPAEPAQAARRLAYDACRAEAASRGLDLADFGTRTTVDDYEQVRRALGIDRWNVYGESYGTIVAMTYAVLHPEPVRSLVLDSIYPPDPAPPWSAIVGRAETAFFAACAAAETCSRQYPALDRMYAETVAKLRDTPLPVPAPPELHRPNGTMLLTAPLWEVLVANRVYYPPFYPGLPHLIASVHDGRTDAVAAALRDLLAAALAMDQPLHAAVECRDRPKYRAALPADAPALDLIQLYGVCGGWPEPDAGPAVPTGTAVPTLVLSGQFDPVSGPELAGDIAARIGPRARLVVFPRVGHNVRHFSPCGAAIASTFIADPAAPLDTSCADRRPPIAFLPP